MSDEPYAEAARDPVFMAEQREIAEGKAKPAKFLTTVFLDGDGENLSACRVLAAMAMLTALLAVVLNRDAGTVAALVAGGAVPLAVRK